MKRWLSGSILLVVVLAIPGLAFSQEFRNLELNPYFAASAHTKSDYQIGFPQTITPFGGEFRYQDALSGGIRFNINTTGHWGEELFFGYEPNKAHIIKKTTPQQEQIYDVRLLNFALNALYYINESETARTRPFLTFGLGGTMNRPTAQAIQVANDPLQGNLPGFSGSSWLTLNYGIGFKHQLSKTFGVRMDVRGYITRNPTFGLPRNSVDPAAIVFPATGSMQTMEVSAGLVVKLKKK
jgi:outer membrane protein W